MSRVASIHMAPARAARPVLHISWLLALPTMIVVLVPFLVSLAVLALYSFQSHSGAPSIAALTIGAWKAFFSDAYSLHVLWTSVWLGLVSTAATLAVAYPVSLGLVRLQSPAVKAFCYLVIFSPLFMSVVVRSYGWLLLLSEGGLVNQIVHALPSHPGPFRLLYTPFGVVIGLVHVLMPFAIMPIVSVLSQQSDLYRQVAMDLGASPMQAFWKTTFPISMPGIVSAAQIVFSLSISAFVTPTVLGGGRVLVLSKLVFDNIGNIEWPTAAVQSLVLLAMALAILVVSTRLKHRVAKQGAA